MTLSASTTTARVVVFAAGLVLAALVAEGALSLTAGRSLWRATDRGEVFEPAAPAFVPTDADLRRSLERLDEAGPYAFHVDPLVGFVCRPDAELTILGGSIRTDGFGMRVRPGTPGDAADGELLAPHASDDASSSRGAPFRVVVLGDSVAFGFGVDDDETLAHRLEGLLTVARAGAPVECRTVAAPGWNHRNAVGFYLDHIDSYPADLVLYMPIGNDLVDGYSVRESGYRREAADVAAADPWLGVSSERSERFLVDVARRLKQQGVRLTQDDVGAACLNADLTPESRRRYDENAASILLLHDVLAARGSELVLLQYAEEPYAFHLWTRLVDAGLDVPVLPLFTAIPPQLRLPDDPHPSPAALELCAAWIADDLLRLARVPDAHAALPAPGPSAATFADARAPFGDAATWRVRSEEARALTARALLPEFDARTGRGALQVLGGLNPDASVGRHALVVLRRTGPTLVVDLAPLAGRADLDGLVVRVAAAGHALGELTLRAGASSSARFAVPADIARGDAVEVLLAASRAVVTEHAGRAQTASFGLLRVAFE